MPGITERLKSIRDKLEAVQAAWGAIPMASGVLNGLIFPAIPITPLLRGLAVLLVVVFSTYAVLWALSRSRDIASGPGGNARLRRDSITILICGVVLLIAYFAFVTHFDQQGVQSQVLDRVIDVAQVVLFAAPWALWAAACVLIAPRK